MGKPEKEVSIIDWSYLPLVYRASYKPLIELESYDENWWIKATRAHNQWLFSQMKYEWKGSKVYFIRSILVWKDL